MRWAVIAFSMCAGLGAGCSDKGDSGDETPAKELPAVPVKETPKATPPADAAPAPMAPASGDAGADIAVPELIVE